MLMGEAYLLNFAEGLSATYEPTVLSDVIAGTVHSAPDVESSNLAEAEPVSVMDGVEMEPLSGEGIDAVAMVISRGGRYVVNDVITDRSINARTDWRVSYPLTRYRNYKPFDEIFPSFDIPPVRKDCEVFGDRRRDSAGYNRPVDAPLDADVSVLLWGNGVANFDASDDAREPCRHQKTSAVRGGVGLTRVVSNGGWNQILGSPR